MDRRQPARGYDQSAVWRARKYRDGLLDLLGHANVDWAYVYPDRWRGGLNDGELADAGSQRRISQHCGARDARGDLLQQLRPFRTETVFELHKAGDVAARPCQARDQAGADRIGGSRKHNWHGSGCLQQRLHRRCAAGHDDVGRERHQFRRTLAKIVRLDAGPVGLDAQVATFTPSQLLQALHQCGVALLDVRIVRGPAAREYADAPHPLTLLCARRQRPRCRAAEQRDELAPPHSMTSSAAEMIAGGISSPSAFAFWRLMTKSILLGSMTGRSPGFSPLRMRPV